MFTIVKIQRINPVTYLLEDYRGKSVTGAFYEHELHVASRYSSGHVSRGESTAQERR